MWPGDELDVDALVARGWRPVPFRDVVLKIHQRCNLACDYCYVYTKADQSWRDRPPVMARATWQAAAARIKEHNPDSVRVILHGGEPLLAGRETLATLAADLAGFDLQLQTNGVLLDEPMLDTLTAAGIRVGVSLDGNGDLHRRYLDGRGSHAGVLRGLRLLSSPRYRDSFAGLLSVVDPLSDPIASYEALLEFSPPAIDFLLPHAHWDDPPRVPCADWLIAVFDRWWDAPARETRIRLFDDLVTLLLGGASTSEQLGLSPVAVVVVESDGAIELSDSLKSTYPGATVTGRNVFDDPFGSVLRHPSIAARQIGAAALSPGCLTCPVHRICGGGHYAHRYRSPDGFRNPTVYCTDMYRLIHHAAKRITDGLNPARTD